MHRLPNYPISPFHHSVEPDKEGFFYPTVDKENCIDCGACEKVCPIIHTAKEKPLEQAAYIVQNKNQKILRESTATRVLVHTKKGREIFNAIKDDFSYVEIEPEAAVAGAKEMKESVAPNEKRESFFKDANRMSGEELFNKYFPETFKVKVEHCIRLTCYKLGIYSAAKKLYVRLTHKY